MIILEFVILMVSVFRICMLIGGEEMHIANYNSLSLAEKFTTCVTDYWIYILILIIQIAILIISIFNKEKKDRKLKLFAIYIVIELIQISTFMMLYNVA